MTHPALRQRALYMLRFAATVQLLLAVALGLGQSPATAVTGTLDWPAIARGVQKHNQLSVAKSLRQTPACRDATKILDDLPSIVAAIDADQQGDALNYLAKFQRRLLCLDPLSVERLDTYMTVYYVIAGSRFKSDPQRDVLRRGLFNVGLLIFDQLLRGQDSAFGDTLFTEHVGYMRALQSYPNMGVWLYDVRFGIMRRMDPLATPARTLDTIRTSLEVWQKRCYLADLKSQGAGLTPPPSGGGNVVSGGGSPAATLPTNTAALVCPGFSDARGERESGGLPPLPAVGQDLTSCTVGAAQAQSAQLGELRCVAETFAGGSRDLNAALRAVFTTNLQGVLDKFCIRPSGEVLTQIKADGVGPYAEPDTGTKAKLRADIEYAKEADKAFLHKVAESIAAAVVSHFTGAPAQAIEVPMQLMSADAVKAAESWSTSVAPQLWYYHNMEQLSEASKEAWSGLQGVDKWLFAQFVEANKDVSKSERGAA